MMSDQTNEPHIVYVWSVTANVKNRETGTVTEWVRNVLGTTPESAIQMFDHENRSQYRVGDADCVCLRVAMVVVAGRGLNKQERDKYPLWDKTE